MGVGGDVVRRPSDAAGLGVGLLGLVVCSWIIFLSDVPPTERDVFRAINELTDALSTPMQWTNQLGTLWLPIVVVAACLVLRAWRAAIDVTVTCLITRVITVATKDWIGRGRPADELVDVVLRGPIPDNFGFPSGHTATATAVVTAIAPHLPRPWRWFAWSGVVLVAFGRVYVGAHLPLDVIGGAALGLAVGSAVHLVLGVPIGSSEDEPIPADAGRLAA